MTGHAIMCRVCGGTGRVERFHGHAYPDECSNCAGSGQNWQYDNGSVAAWQGGPFIGGVVRCDPMRPLVPA